VAESPKKKVQSAKYIISMIWGNTGVKSLLHVLKGMKYNTTFFIESVVFDLVETSISRAEGERFEVS
jgi:hypothetical protein